MRLLRAVHRWLGLALALIVLAVSVSGGLLLLRDPYYRVTYPELARPISDAQRAARAHVLTAIEARWSRAQIQLVKFPRPGVNAFQVWLRDGSEAFVHPSSAALIDQWHWSRRLPAFLFELHAHLLAEDSGTVVNGIAALALLFMAASGVLLWWPARRGAFRLRGAIPRTTRPAALLRSHAATGALVSIPVLLFAATGAAIVFYDQVERGVTAVLDGTPAQEPDAHISVRTAHVQPWTAVLHTLDSTFPDGDSVFYYPGTMDNARLMFRKRLPGEWHPNGRSYIVVDPYTASAVQAIDARAQGAGTRLMHAIYPVHAAKVGGWMLTLAAAVAAVGLAYLASGGAWTWWAKRRLRARSAS